ncbi:alpha/beta fold hydrolase [Cellulosimicrobium arenosum]|uniref:Alpha/beta fold hydrolase n=2 Tax=Cellulosimicrobium arenosum TaxID=2708133 RepID=A0A927PG12_9MICO|nr:alpha/beta fold hydrolase [Cellulosimicrobium arenosum]
MLTTTAFGPVSTVDAGPLTVGYVEVGDPDATPVVLLHGYPYDVHSYVDVAPLLAGYDWGGRAACGVAALWPERVRGLVSVNSYLEQDVAASQAPIRPELEAGFWYFWYFSTERGRRGLEQNRAEVARVIRARNSPERTIADADLARSAVAFDNPDYVDVVIHSYRHRLGLAPGDPTYEGLERWLARLPRIDVPTITLDGLADGNFPATDGTQSATHFGTRREHRQVPHAGHELPAEAPRAFASAVLDLARTPARLP